MGVSVAGLSAAALLGGISGRTSVASVALSRPLSDEARARPEATLLAGALDISQSSGSRQGALIQVPPSPLASGTLQALQQSSQQFAVRSNSIETQIAEAPQRELRRALNSVVRESTVTTPDTTISTTVQTPSTTVTRTVTETVTVPGEESAGVQELRSLLERAAARAGESEDRGSGRSSDRRVQRYADSVERRGDQLLDSLDRIVDRGGSQTDRRVERALDGLGESLVRTIDRLFDRGGERGVSALDEIVEENSSRIVGTFGRVLEATGDDVNRQLEDLLVRAGPEVIEALQGAVDRVRPTTTEERTREVTEVIPGTTETVTTTIPGSTITTSNREIVEQPPTPTEARAEVRRQVTAYSNASNLIAPLEELASPPPAVPNPAAAIQRVEPGGDGAGLARDARGPIRREDNEGDRRVRQTRDENRFRIEEPRPRPEIVVERPEPISAGLSSLAPPIRSTEESSRQPGSLVEIAA